MAVLTNAQLTTLKTWLTNNAPSVQDEEAAAMLNALATGPDWFVWQTSCPVKTILDNVTWANYTPNDAPSETLIYQNRAILLQIKQINLQLMLQGRETFDASKATLRGGLQDATQNLPSGTAGVDRAGGWLNIQPSLSRRATVGEKLYANGGLGTVATPSTMTVEGAITASNVSAARNLP